MGKSISEEAKNAAREWIHKYCTPEAYAMFGERTWLESLAEAFDVFAKEREDAARASIVAWLREFSTHNLETENKFAAHGSYDSAAEMAAWKHGIREAADAIERREDERGESR